MNSKAINSKTDQPAETNPVVFRCCEAWKNAYDAAFRKSQDDDVARFIAQKAFADAMPPVLGLRNTRDFIACVAHRSASHMVSSKHATRLLYAAQVAFCTRRLRSAKPTNTRSMSKKSHSGAISGPKNAIQEPFFAPDSPAQTPAAQ
jgi:hypothetical protein